MTGKLPLVCSRNRSNQVRDIKFTRDITRHKGVGCGNDGAQVAGCQMLVDQFARRLADDRAVLIKSTDPEIAPRLAPAVLLMTTCFVRMSVVLSLDCVCGLR